jgi:hypothetical protein
MARRGMLQVTCERARREEMDVACQLDTMIKVDESLCIGCGSALTWRGA